MKNPIPIQQNQLLPPPHGCNSAPVAGFQGADARRIAKKGSAFFDILSCFDAGTWQIKLICHCKKLQCLPEQGNATIHLLLTGEGELLNERSEFSNSGEVMARQDNRIVPSPKNLMRSYRIDFSHLPSGKILSTQNIPTWQDKTCHCEPCEAIQCYYAAIGQDYHAHLRSLVMTWKEIMTKILDIFNIGELLCLN